MIFLFLLPIMDSLSPHDKEVSSKSFANVVPYDFQPKNEIYFGVWRLQNTFLYLYRFIWQKFYEIKILNLKQRAPYSRFEELYSKEDKRDKMKVTTNPLPSNGMNEKLQGTYICSLWIEDLKNVMVELLTRSVEFIDKMKEMYDNKKSVSGSKYQ